MPLRRLPGLAEVDPFTDDLVAAKLHDADGHDRRGADMTILERTVNGQPGLVIQRDGVTETVMAFDVTSGRITHIWAVRNPEKLRPWTIG